MNTQELNKLCRQIAALPTDKDKLAALQALPRAQWNQLVGYVISAKGTPWKDDK